MSRGVGVCVTCAKVHINGKDQLVMSLIPTPFPLGLCTDGTNSEGHLETFMEESTNKKPSTKCNWKLSTECKRKPSTECNWKLFTRGCWEPLTDCYRKNLLLIATRTSPLYAILNSIMGTGNHSLTNTGSLPLEEPSNK